MPQPSCCRVSRRNPPSCSKSPPADANAAECVMSRAEQAFEIGATNPDGVRRGHRRSIDWASAIRRRAAGGLAVLAGLVAATTTVPLQAQTLTQALADAYNTNPQLLAQRALLRATDEQVPQALANWRPTVNFTGQVGGTRSAVTSQGLQMLSRNGASLTNYSTFYSNTLNLAATQQIYS